ncbi:hypothetical protein SAMN02745121_08993 [Nannocystis exedens]|uniref:Tryptophan synthase alpha chain n=1 Tax=Nannocystis exedens TaxID=54 RepID=A0A1I2IZQ8_9BACT|nr:hypothetical protein [Nannocystis exedens]PCC67114.1 hypothetical protein NAEX_00117 [Nannocystis exedens]SFF45961.1 hypothetical protein SAMN02745121_08993 [Nannocystis exedens]
MRPSIFANLHAAWFGSVYVLVAAGQLGGCAAPCVDDGAVWNQNKAGCPALVTDSASESGTGSGATSEATAPTGSGATSEATASTGGGGSGCDDGVQSGDETDVDCGGSCTNTCEDGGHCLVGDDCTSHYCIDETCAPDPACVDGILDGSETDVDCGGSCGPSCEIGEVCVFASDCASDYCEAASDTCQEPTCSDGVQNGDETDIDCGGACGPLCGTGEGCVIDDDCASGLCETGGCGSDPLCQNGALDPGETDVDCGGPCGPTCEDGEGCGNGSDCVHGYCEATMTCATPDCGDGVQNGDETDVDCGGACGPTCEDGEHCLVPGDCVDDNCNPLEVCAAPECAITGDDNACQACIKGSCCDTVTECLADPKCACWLECIKMNNDFDPCKTQCQINGNPGPITACANSKCNAPAACGVQ